MKPDSAPRGSVRIERSPKRVRAYLGGAIVADSLSPLLVWEAPYYPTYYFPPGDIRAELLDEGGPAAHSPSRGDARTLTVRAGGRDAVGAALRYDEARLPELEGAVRLQWDAMDAWFEEDEEVYTHARDPYTRIDILASTRRVRVLLDGVELADSSSPHMLFETGLPVRYYLPRTTVHMELLERSETVTHCPYKGRAQSWSARIGDELRADVAWSYPAPLPESEKVAGLMAFYNEKLAVELDGEIQERPVAKFS